MPIAIAIDSILPLPHPRNPGLVREEGVVAAHDRPALERELAPLSR
jgi:hypothetical protein